ncbi:Rha family transcriptional regulator [Candidatus Francisella endociliophora]|uniref:Rha family transcriptional regulator n=1 Tax=Candidatus Francisella endociliophora TaxID=653937 RepID=UPI0006933180|nr:Rha family transcriptional regulator [Francisella sp. FSC1006]
MQIKLRNTEKNIIETGEFFNPNIDIKMTSRDIAELTGKNHADIMRDIRKEIADLGIELGESIFALTSYLDRSNRQSPQYIFSRKGIMQLALKYNPKTRFKVISKLEELEESNYRNFNNTILHRTLELEKQIAYNGSEWGRMGVDQREARKGFKEFEEAIKKLIQPDLPLED